MYPESTVYKAAALAFLLGTQIVPLARLVCFFIERRRKSPLDFRNLR